MAFFNLKQAKQRIMFYKAWSTIGAFFFVRGTKVKPLVNLRNHHDLDLKIVRGGIEYAKAMKIQLKKENKK